MYMVHTSTLLFKDNHLRSQVLPLGHLCWSVPLINFTPRMWTGLSFQQKGAGSGTPPVQAISRKPSLLSKLILAPDICSYLTTAFFTAFISKQQDIKTVTSSAYADTFAKRGPAKKIPRRARVASWSLSLRSRGSKART